MNPGGVRGASRVSQILALPRFLKDRAETDFKRENRLEKATVILK
jgi:hypothetical protein